MSSKAPVTVLPKPCLKQTLGMTFNSQQKHAHFPPASEEAKRYSGVDYDRTPITVIANELALPERGCPGRTFDDVEGHHRHHHPKKACKSDAYKSNNSGNHVHPNCYVVAAVMPMELSQPQLTTRSGAMPPLSTIHGDTSESEGDLSPPLSDSSGSMAKVLHPKRIRKVNTADRQQRASGIRLQRTNDLTTHSPTSTFASCPGSNSCLGGF